MQPNTFIYLEFLRKTLLSLPAVTEKLCFDTPAFYASKKIICRIREDGETLALQTMERDKWMAAHPEIFFLTDHYRNYDFMLVNMEKIEPALLQQLLVTAWRNRSGKKAVTIFEQQLLTKHKPL